MSGAEPPENAPTISKVYFFLRNFLTAKGSPHDSLWFVEHSFLEQRESALPFFAYNDAQTFMKNVWKNLNLIV